MAAINAACLALIDAGIAMKDIVAAASCTYLDDKLLMGMFTDRVIVM